MDRRTIHGIGILIFVLDSVVSLDVHLQKKIDIQRNKRSIEESGNDFPGCDCKWSEWMNNNNYSPFTGDDNSYDNLRRHYDFCAKPTTIDCRDVMNPQIPFFFIQQDGVECDVTNGLVCVSRLLDRNSGKSEKPLYCDDYEIRVLCCDCPQTTVEATTNVIVTSQSNIVGTTKDYDEEDVTYNTTTPYWQEEPVGIVIPVSIIIVIIIAFVVVIGSVLCYVLSHRGRPRPKHTHDYMESDTRDLQRPVSFGEFDHQDSRSSSSLTTSSSEGSYPSYKFTQLDKGKLQFIQAECQDEPDVISSAKRVPHVNQIPEERKWLPDEYEHSLEKQRKPPKKSYSFSRSFSPVNKTIPFMDDDN